MNRSRIPHLPGPARPEHTTPARALRRAALLVAALATALLIPAGTASARGGDWQPVTGLPSVVPTACGSTAVNLTFRDNKEFQLETTLPDGTVVTKFTGSLTAHFAAANGATLDQNIGGPGVVTKYPFPNLDTRFRSEGHFNYIVNSTEAAQLGVPQIFSTTGLIEFVEHADGTATPITMPNHVIDVCALLGLG